MTGMSASGLSLSNCICLYHSISFLCFFAPYLPNLTLSDPSSLSPNVLRVGWAKAPSRVGTPSGGATPSGQQQPSLPSYANKLPSFLPRQKKASTADRPLVRPSWPVKYYPSVGRDTT